MQGAFIKGRCQQYCCSILEQGCPPASFPFEVEYHKPVARSKNKPAEKEKVTIKKKERTPKRVIENESRPRVIM